MPILQLIILIIVVILLLSVLFAPYGGTYATYRYPGSIILFIIAVIVLLWLLGVI